LWKELEGLDRRKTPLSDHLLEVMTNWRSSFAGVSAEFELMFERFELLAALAYLEENSEASLEQAFADTPHGLFARMPVGRVGWHDSSANALILELQSEATITALLDAGFARNSRRFLELSIESFKRYMNKMSW
ncbi:TPA: hypothetical protein OW434_001066, partial [Pseudomonas aeruginosa]|nr:hypothetical protein [Pseudomonas aeruginosa]